MEDKKEGKTKTKSLVRKSIGNIVLLVVSIALIGFGIYNSNNSVFSEREDVDVYNQAVISYRSGVELMPATDERPSETSTERAVAYYKEAINESNDDDLKSIAYFNMGTIMGEDALSALMGNTSIYGVNEAISNLSEAVRLDSENEAAKYNLEVLLEVKAILVTETGVFSSYQITLFEDGNSQMQGGYSSGGVDEGY
jgi:hypothetical protein